MIFIFVEGVNGSECSVPDFDYYGGDIELVKAVSSEDQCQLECQHLLECLVWTYRHKFQECYLKNALYDIRHSPGAIAGPKYCPSKQINFCLKEVDND